MPLAKNKWRRSIAVLLCAMLIFSTAFSFTAFADNAVVTSGSMYSYFQTFSSKGQWVDVMTPSHWITDTGEVAYCLQTSKDSPYNSGYHTVEGSDYYDQRTLTGLYAILENGYPVTTGGFSDEQARYATANAIRFWCAENYCEGMPQYLNLNVNGDWIRGKYGYEDLYNWCLGLVQKARNQATSSPSTGSISFSPTSLTLTEDANGNYFVGSATVSKSISGSYGLSHNLPDGSSITGYSGNSGDRLSIQIPTDYGEQSFTITVYGSHSANTAKLFFWQPDAYNQQRVVTCVLDTDSTYVEANMTVITPKATPKNGSIQLTKLDEGGNPLPGVSFALYDSTKQQISSGTTDGSGIIIFADLPLGSYYYAETAALPGYVLDSTLYPTSISEGGQLVTVTATNILARGNVSVLKTDETGAPLGGVHFTLTNSAGQIVAEGDTPDDGKLTFSGLLLGSYTLQETATVPGYVLDTTPIPVEVTEHGQTVTVNATNLFARGNVSVLKTNVETGAALPGVHFTLTDNCGQIVSEGDTPDDGALTFSGLQLGSYTLQETATVEGFVLNSDPIPVEVAEHGQTVEISMTNTPIRGNLKIVKRDAYEDIPLSGAGFRLFDSGGHLIDEGYTDANGELTFESLLYGSYQYQEFAPPKGYKLDDTVYPFSIMEHGVTITQERDNLRRPGTLEVKKQDQNGKPLVGAAFLLEYSTDNGASWTAVFSRSGDDVQTGGCTSSGLSDGQLTTGDSGSVTFSGLRADSSILYRLTETQAPVGRSLLGSPLYVGTLPVEISGTAEDSETVDGVSCCYTLYVTATDDPLFRLPETGGAGFAWLPYVMGFLTMPYIITKRKDERET